MVKQPTSEPSEFTMSSEDFPALPGTQNREGPSPGGSVSGDKNIPVGLGPEIGQDVLQANRAPGSEKSQSSKRGIQTSPDGKRKNEYYYREVGYSGTLNNFTCRQGDEHTCKYGEGSIRHGWAFNVYQSSGDRPELGVAGVRPRSYRVRIEFEFAGKSLSKLWWPLGGNTLSATGY